MFWTNDVNILFQPVLIPMDHMSVEEKLNALTRLVIFVCLIVSLLLQDSRFILLMIILIIAIAIIYQYYSQYNVQSDTFLNSKNLNVVENKLCVKPTQDNPFMNPILTDITDDEYNSANVGACPIYNDKIDDSIDKIYDESIYKNADDIYDRTTGKRQFYTVPGNKVPNDQDVFANWLYNRGKSCKENNGAKCYDNLYRDLRL